MIFSFIKTEIKVVIGALFAGSAVGFLTAWWALAYATILVVVMIWFLTQIARLHRWINAGAKIDDTPRLFGASKKVVEQICLIKQENTAQYERSKELIRRFEAATAAMPDAMLIIDNSFNIEWANEASKGILGIDAHKDTGRNVTNIVRDPVITNYLTRREFAQPLEFTSTRSEENDLVLRVIPYGQVHSLMYVQDHMDVLRLQQVRKAFISNASHEMRTPLTVIIGYLETLMLRDDSPADVSRGISGALEQAHRLKKLIEDLLSLSRLESLPLSQSHVDVVDVLNLVRECIELVKASSIYNQQMFEIRAPDAALIRGDQTELLSAIQNVIDNAVKYSLASTRIVLEWRVDPIRGAFLSIQDFGEGVEKLHLSRLAERFYRVDKGRSRDMGGTGLGLSIVKHVMERHGGQVKIDSELGVGTEVKLLFPPEILVSGEKRKAS